MMICLACGVMIGLGLRDMTSKTNIKISSGVDKLNFLGGLLSAVFSAAVTLLTASDVGYSAGRVWKINRDSQAHLGIENGGRKLSLAVRIILESGLIHPTMMIIHLSVLYGSISKKQLPPVDLYPAVVLTAGMAPTLSIVWAQIAKLTERSTAKVGGISDIRFNNNGWLGRNGEISGVSHTVSLQIQSRSDLSEDEFKFPEPLVYPRQSVVLPSSFAAEEVRATIDVEKGLPVKETSV
ncbi:hypothetical protein V5O48_004186 [Marasmius crinis-equi]|uniref:Uncharacterized protein n=1 Tax=Marasmius crinis-equi TaxID=585013 RepID=A0ABR3FQU2_9AGAR